MKEVRLVPLFDEFIQQIQTQNIATLKMQQKQLKKPNQGAESLGQDKLFSFLSAVRKLGNQGGNCSIISNAFTLSIVIHTLFGYILLSNDFFSSYSQRLRVLVQNQELLLCIVSIANYLVIISTVITLFLVSKNFQPSPIAKFCLEVVFQNIEIITKLSLCLSSYLAYFDFQANVAALIFASFLHILENLLLGNFESKILSNYQFSSQLSLAFDFWLVLSLLSNTAIVTFLDLQVYCKWSIFMSIGLVYWYTKGGFKLYYNKLMSFMLRVVLALTVSLSVEFGILLLIQQPQQKNFDFAEWSIAFIAIYIFSHIFASSQTLKISNIEEYIRLGRVKQVELNLSQALEEVDAKIENLGFITGMIDEHSRRICLNQRCWLKKKSVFGAANQLSESQANYVISKDSICKHFMRCIYETALLQTKSSKIMIDYCQFMLAEYQDLYSYYLYLQKPLTLGKLSLLQRIKVAKMKAILQQKYNIRKKYKSMESTDLLDILNSQNQCDLIFQKIRLYCRNQIEFQDFMRQEEIDLKEIREIIVKSSSLLSEVDRKWAKVSKLFAIEKNLYFVYILYKFYIKNETIKSSTLKDVSQSLSSTKKPIMKSSQKAFLKQDLLLDPNSAIVVAVFNENELICYKTSKSFSKLTLYQEEIINAPLNLILPFEIRSYHTQIVLEGLKYGKLHFEAEEKIKSTYFVNKNQEKIQCTVFFNLFIDFQEKEQAFKFIAYIKRHLSPDKIFDENLQEESIAQLPSLNSKNLSLLNNSENIFLKDQDIQPATDNLKINQIKHLLRLFTAISIMIVVAISIATSIAANKQTKLANMWNYSLFLYRYPMNMAKNYLKMSLQIGDSNQTYSKIVFARQSLSQYINDQQTIQFLTDETINSYGNYLPYRANPINKNISYDQIDLFYVIMQCLMTLSSKPGINRTGYEFIQLDSYLKPGFDSIMNNTKIQFHYKLASQIISSRFEQQIILVLAIGVFAILTMIILWKFVIYSKLNKETFQILFQFKKGYDNKVIKYWNKVRLTFEVFLTKQQTKKAQEISDFAIKKSTTGKFPSEELDKQVKQFSYSYSNSKQTRLNTQRQDEHDSNVKIGFVFAIILGMCPILALEAYNLVQLAQISDFQATGFKTFRFYPVSTIIGYALMTKYYSQAYPLQSQFKIQRFQDTISNLNIISQTDYLADSDQSSIFWQKVRNYLFKNPCTYNPFVLDNAKSTLSDCLSYSNQTLATGLISYLRYLAPQVEDYLSGRVNHTAMEIDSIITGFELVGLYFSDLIQSWTDEFSGKLSSLKNFNFFLLILITSFILIVHFVIFELWYLKSLEKQHKLVKHIFDHLVPSQILSSQKLVKHKFQEAGAFAAA